MENLLDEATGSVPGTPQRLNLSTGPKVAPISSAVVLNAAAPKKNPVKVQSLANASIFHRSDVVPVVIPRNSLRFENAAESRKEGIIGRTMPLSLQSKGSDVRIFSNNKDDVERPIASSQPEIEVSKSSELNMVADKNSITVGKSSISDILGNERKKND